MQLKKRKEFAKVFRAFYNNYKNELSPYVKPGFSSEGFTFVDKNSEKQLMDLLVRLTNYDNSIYPLRKGDIRVDPISGGTVKILDSAAELEIVYENGKAIYTTTSYTNGRFHVMPDSKFIDYYNLNLSYQGTNAIELPIEILMVSMQPASTQAQVTTQQQITKQQAEEKLAEVVENLTEKVEPEPVVEFVPEEGVTEKQEGKENKEATSKLEELRRKKQELLDQLELLTMEHNKNMSAIDSRVSELSEELHKLKNPTDGKFTPMQLFDLARLIVTYPENPLTGTYTSKRYDVKLKKKLKKDLAAIGLGELSDESIANMLKVLDTLKIIGLNSNKKVDVLIRDLNEIANILLQNGYTIQGTEALQIDTNDEATNQPETEDNPTTEAEVIKEDVDKEDKITPDLTSDIEVEEVEDTASYEEFNEDVGFDLRSTLQEFLSRIPDAIKGVFQSNNLFTNEDLHTSNYSFYPIEFQVDGRSETFTFPGLQSILQRSQNDEGADPVIKLYGFKTFDDPSNPEEFKYVIGYKIFTKYDINNTYFAKVAVLSKQGYERLPDSYKRMNPVFETVRNNVNYAGKTIISVPGRDVNTQFPTFTISDTKENPSNSLSIKYNKKSNKPLTAKAYNGILTSIRKAGFTPIKKDITITVFNDSSMRELNAKYKGLRTRITKGVPYLVIPVKENPNTPIIIRLSPKAVDRNNFGEELDIMQSFFKKVEEFQALSKKMAAKGQLTTDFMLGRDDSFAQMVTSMSNIYQHFVPDDEGNSKDLGKTVNKSGLTIENPYYGRKKDGLLTRILLAPKVKPSKNKDGELLFDETMFKKYRKLFELAYQIDTDIHGERVRTRNNRGVVQKIFDKVAKSNLVWFPEDDSTRLTILRDERRIMGTKDGKPVLKKIVAAGRPLLGYINKETTSHNYVPGGIVYNSFIDKIISRLERIKGSKLTEEELTQITDNIANVSKDISKDDESFRAQFTLQELKALFGLKNNVSNINRGFGLRVPIQVSMVNNRLLPGQVDPARNRSIDIKLEDYFETNFEGVEPTIMSIYLMDTGSKQSNTQRKPPPPPPPRKGKPVPISEKKLEDMLDASNVIETPVDADTSLNITEEATPAPIVETPVTVEVIDLYTNAYVKSNPDKVFVFGDNVQRTGTGGQAQIRNNSNAMGIATKLAPSTSASAYMSDRNLNNNKSIIDADISKIKATGKTVVFPKDGLGTGLAKLKEKAPKTYDYLRQRLLEEFGFDNDTGKVSRPTAQEVVTEVRRVPPPPPKRITPKGTINVYWGNQETATNTRVLSNLAPRSFVYKGVEYGSVEHAYQVNKSGTFDKATHEKYLKVGGYGKKIAPSVSLAQLKSANSLQLMKDLVVESFRQNPNSEAADMLIKYKNFTHNNSKLAIDIAFIEGLELAQKEILKLRGAAPVVQEEVIPTPPPPKKSRAKKQKEVEVEVEPAPESIPIDDSTIDTRSREQIISESVDDFFRIKIENNTFDDIMDPIVRENPDFIQAIESDITTNNVDLSNKSALLASVDRAYQSFYCP